MVHMGYSYWTFARHKFKAGALMFSVLARRRSTGKL